MNSDGFGIRDHAVGTAAGQIAIVAALVVVLDKNGIVPRQQYCDALHRLWSEMPEEQAMGAAGELVERVLDHIGVPLGRDEPALPGEPESELLAAPETPSSGGHTASSGSRPLNSILNAVRRLGWGDGGNRRSAARFGSEITRPLSDQCCKGPAGFRGML